MSDDDKSMDVQFICNQHVLTYNTFWFMNPMVLSVPWADSHEIIALQSVQMQVMKPKGLSSPWANSIEIILLRQVEKFVRDELNGL